MLILIGMPIVQIILFGFAISTEVRNVQTAILTSSVNSDTRHIIDRLDASEYFTVKYVVHTNEELNQLFRKGKIELGIAFPRELQRQRFDSESIQIIADATDPNLAITAVVMPTELSPRPRQNSGKQASNTPRLSCTQNCSTTRRCEVPIISYRVSWD